MASPGKEVNAEVFSFLHVELVEHTLGAAPSDADFQKAALKLEAIGFAVGHRLVERYTRDRPRFSDTLEIIKFICKDFWCRRAILRRNSAHCSDDQSATALRYEVYRKQIDKLQTNNRGVYMLLDNKLKLLARCSPNAARQDAAKQHGALYAQFPSGLIRGALHGLGVSAVVGVEVNELPACHFTVRIQKAKEENPE